MKYIKNLANDHPQDGKSEYLDTAGAVLIPGAAEVAQRNKADREEQNNKLLLDLHKRQTEAQESQSQSNFLIAMLTAVMVAITLANVGVSYLQFKAARISAEAAITSANAAKDAVKVAQDAPKFQQ